MKGHVAHETAGRLSIRGESTEAEGSCISSGHLALEAVMMGSHKVAGGFLGVMGAP